MNKFRSLVIAIALVCCFMLINYAAARPDTTLAVPGHSHKTQLGMVRPFFYFRLLPIMIGSG
ncbi:hypothetical protein WN944_007820 [Citrus x changshan-huyou]|uniref:Uncharacterized protein n=1 Tax=Citrus x changshan-huyou TaxID=2935761 RepID=A0AAP0MP29_9ROSI